MGLLEVGLWLIASLGWFLDWVSTVWPNRELPEQNPFVVKLFGKFPNPLFFGIGKAAGLIITVLLYAYSNYLLQSYDYLPVSLFNLNPSLLIPVVIGVIGWHGFLHNLRLLIQN
jgi:hypothetical protein